MRNWKPTGFKPEWPDPNEGCAFVLGGSLHGEIVQEQPLPRYFEHPLFPAGDFTEENAIKIERYRLEEFRVGQEQQTVWFYIHEGSSTSFAFIKAFTDLCMFMRDARNLTQ